MSYDRQIDQICPHEVVEEALFLATDRQTVRPLRPIASIASVKMRLNREIEVPSVGVTIPAQAVGSKDGPFNITAAVNDTLVVTLNGMVTQTATLPASKQMPADKLAFLLNEQLQGIYFSAAGRRVMFQTTGSGRGATVQFTSASTLASSLGFLTTREFRGQQLVPGWTIVVDPTTITPGRQSRNIIFDEPLKSATDFVEIDYATVAQECRRCGGVGVEHDWRYAGNGQMITVSDEALLIQEVQKDFFTTLGSNPFHTWYGTQLLDTIGKKLTAGGFIQNLIVSDIYQAFTRWQQIKQQQEQKVGQVVSDKEYPFRLLSVNLQQSTQDPTVIFVQVAIQNRSTEPIQIERGLRIPLPLDLLGSTQQQGLIRQSLTNFVLAG
jgi:hypothetical protein